MTIDTSKYKKRGVDLKGFWNPDLGPIHCIPRAAKLFDGNIDETKPSTLLIVELVEPCEAVVAKSEDDPDETEHVATQTGDQVGVWGKPGMAAIKTLCGVPVLIEYERDSKGQVVTKKMKKKGVNPMKCFNVLSETNPNKLIPVIEDTRIKSAHLNTLLAPAKSSRLAPNNKTPDQSQPNDTDDIPF